MMYTQLKIIQQNIIKWTRERAVELSMYYNREQADVVLLNATGIPDTQIIKMYNYNIIQKNAYSEEHAGIAIAIKKNIKYKI